MSNRIVFPITAAALGLVVGCGGGQVSVAVPQVGVAVPQVGVAGPVIAVAAPIGLPDRTLIRGGDKDKLYIIVNGRRRLTDAKTVDALGIPSINAREISPGEFAAIPEGKGLRTDWKINKLIPQDLTKARNRTLIRSSDSPRIYIVCNGQRHWVDDMPTFAALGLNPNEIITITPEQMATVPEGPVW